MWKFITQFFTWWNGSTLNTRFYLWRTAKPIGTDQFGNEYFLTASGERYVQYAGEADASTVPPGWSGWLHHRVDVTPDESGYVPREWELPHKPNLTGTAGAYRPKGSIANQGARPEVAGDYDAWTP